MNSHELATMPASIGPDEKMVYNYTSESDDCLIISKSPSPLEVLFVSRPAHFSIFDPRFSILLA